MGGSNMSFVASLLDASWIAVAIDLSLKVGLFFAAAALAAFLLRLQSAAVRHRIWSAAFCGALAISAARASRRPLFVRMNGAP